MKCGTCGRENAIVNQCRCDPHNLPTHPHYSLCEAVADLAQNFARADTLPGDSREVIRLCIEWAEAFEEKNKAREWDGEYMEEIDAWFQSHYDEWLNHASDTVSNH